MLSIRTGGWRIRGHVMVREVNGTWQVQIGRMFAGILAAIPA